MCPEDIRKAFVADGRHIFVFGDRGVGKTSLAQTAAYQYQSSDQNPIILTCDPSATFYRLAQDLASALLRTDPTITKKISSRKANISWSGLSGETQEAVERGVIPDLRSINEVTALLSFGTQLHSKSPVAVVDEFERITSRDDRMLFADLIKQIGDRSVPIKLIFCGVGSSLNDLLDAHHSCYRYLTTIQLERLSIDGRLDIIDGASRAFGLTVGDTTRYRIAKISDGFPHFVHLVCEKMFWELFDDSDINTRVLPRHFAAAIRSAVTDIEPHLRIAYERATKKYTDDYEEVLWAAADSHLLSRRSTDIFQSYSRIMAERLRTPLARDRFNQRMNALKKQTHGGILKATRAGWYEFSENMVRGYVRLRAQEKDVELDPDHPLMARRRQGQTAVA